MGITLVSLALYVYLRIVTTISDGLTFQVSHNIYGSYKFLTGFIKSSIAGSVVRAMIFFGDNPADKRNADVFGGLFFFFLYLHFIPLSHLLFLTLDFGISEGLFAVSMTIFSHSFESHGAQIAVWLIGCLVFNLGYLKYDPVIAKKIRNHNYV